MPWWNFGVITQAIWPSEQKEIEYGGRKLVLMPMTRDNFASIHVEMSGLSSVEAMTLINRFLSALAWKCDEPAFCTGGWGGNPMPVPVQRHDRRLGYSPSSFYPEYLVEISDDKAKLAIALYREGLSLESIPYKFLSFFKILNIFWKDKTINNENLIITELRHYLYRIDNEEAIKRVTYISDKFGDAAQYLYKSGRCAVAHAYIDPIVDPDDISDSHRLSEDMCVVKCVAKNLIKEKFKIEQSIFT